MATHLPIVRPVISQVAKTITPFDSSTSLEQYVDAQAVEDNINPNLVNCIVNHESQWLNRSGDHGNSRGIFQISDIYHPEVSNAVAYSVVSSTAWALHWIVAGHVAEWSR